MDRRPVQNKHRVFDSRLFHLIVQTRPGRFGNSFDGLYLRILINGGRNVFVALIWLERSGCRKPITNLTFPGEPCCRSSLMHCGNTHTHSSPSGVLSHTHTFTLWNNPPPQRLSLCCLIISSWVSTFWPSSSSSFMLANLSSFAFTFWINTWTARHNKWAPGLNNTFNLCWRRRRR